MGIISTALAAIAPEPLSPLNVSWVTYLWVLVLSGAGGVVNFVGKVKRGEARAMNFAELVGEISTSGFVGLLTFWLCQWQALDAMLSAVVIGVSAHMGSRALFAAEKVMEGIAKRHWPEIVIERRRPRLIRKQPRKPK